MTDLLAKNVQRSLWQNASKERQLVADCSRACEQSIQRNECGNGRKDREQTVEYHAGRNREQTVLADLLIGAPEDVFPALPRYLPWRLGATAAAGLLRPFVLRGIPFVGAAAGSKSAAWTV